jgi:hypothetical protein
MIYACLSIQPLHNFIGNYTACISQFFVMNRAKQCKCQAIFGDPFMDWLLIIRICKLVGHLIQLSFFVLSYFVLHANCFDLLSFCYSSWSAILPQLFGCSWLSSQRLQCRCQHPWSTQDMVDDGRVGGRRVVEWSPRGEAGTVTAVDVADMVGTLYRQHFITMDGGLLFLCSCIYVHSSRWHVVCCHINEQTWQFICSCTTSLAFFEQSFYCSSFVFALLLPQLRRQWYVKEVIRPHLRQRVPEFPGVLPTRKKNFFELWKEIGVEFCLLSKNSAAARKTNLQPAVN